MKSIDLLEKQIVDWGTQKGILPNANRYAQFKKTVEECDELLLAIDKHDKEEAKDAIGDIFVTLVMQSRAWDLTMVECIEAAYDQIKNRKGKMVDGQFVKEQ